ncbi:succinate dehydrogenase assembly factor 2 [uncultured Marinobacter sp.]|uniref:FAD assembly factor SdhE n=1 Tax=uncultured Marinobacter sp. TaxID=187379 RepID=UPI00260BFF22|nr:succinate dehydrogenase assembly factor 2 [uncultured Marinobacter sp.]
MQDTRSTSDSPEFKRLWWHSRRGMLELDVLLLPFLEEAYLGLDEEDQKRYEKLLTCEDTDMFEWFMQRSRPDDADLQRIVDIILSRVQPD